MTWAPENIAGAVGVWVADDIAIGDGSAVSAWADRISSLSLAQATGSKQPLYRTTGINSQPAVDFDGTDDLLRYGGTLSTASSGSVFLVISADDFSTAPSIWSTSDEATINFRLIADVNASGQIEVNQSNNDTADTAHGTTTTISTATTYLLEWASTGTAYSLRVNGTVQSLTVSSGSNTGDWFGDTSNRDNFVLGALKRTTEIGFYNGKIATAAVVDGTISAQDRNSLYNWTNGKYGLTLPVSLAAPFPSPRIRRTLMR